MKPTHLVVAAALIYAALAGTLSLVSHYGLRTQMNDLGNMDQAIWAASRGDLEMTVSNTFSQKLRSRFAAHSNIIFLPLAILYVIYPTPVWLLLLSSVACAAAGLGLYAVARRRLGDSYWSMVPPLAFLASPLVHDANLYDFHVITLATALLVWMFWAFDCKRYRLGWTLLVLAMLCKEDVPFVLLMFGLHLFLSGTRRLGVRVVVVSLLYVLFLQFVFLPLFAETQGFAGTEQAWRYQWLPFGLVELTTDPLGQAGKLLAHVTRPDRLRIVVYLLLSGALAGFRAWRVLLLLLPCIAFSVLSEPHVFMTRITGTYYFVMAEAIIVLACILSVRICEEKSGRFYPWPLAYLGLATLLFSFLFSPFPHSIAASWKSYTLPPERQAFHEVRALIPQDSSVCVQNNLGPHLSQRRDIAEYPRRCERAKHALFFLRWHGAPDRGLFVRTDPAFLLGAPPRALLQAVRRRIVSPTWGLVAQKDGVYLFARGQPSLIPTGEALEVFRRDTEELNRAVAKSKGKLWDWARYLNGPVSWSRPDKPVIFWP